VRVRTERTGKIFDLREPFRSGGEGAIYEVPYYPNLMAKVYHAQRRTPERIAKLQIMVAHPPVNPTEHLNHPSIAWPTELLRDTATNQLVGFVMPRVRQMLPLSEVYNPRARRRQRLLFNYRYLVRTARNLCAAVQAVHQAGYVIGDLNESNVLVSDQALVTLVDADSFQVRDPETGVLYRSLVGKPEYTPPELQGCSFADVDRQPEHDAFALAVLIFRLLMEGFHPFDGVYRGRGEPPEMGARIRNGYFPYARGRTGIEPSPLAPPFEMLHPDLQALFVRCFEEGHRNRRVRLRVEDWLEALEGAEDALQQCSQNEQHYYWVHWSGCPWCARQQALGGRDPFPSRASVSSGQHLGVSASAASPVCFRHDTCAYSCPVGARGGWFVGAHPHGAHRCGLERVVFAGWELAGVGEWGWHHQVVACGGWFVGAHPHGAHKSGLERVVFAGWELAGVGDCDHQVVACGGWFVGAHPHGAHRCGQERVVFAGWELAGVGELG
jgi:DNA-binding helix-hairpin-helix protein with protein kinase domain